MLFLALTVVIYQNYVNYDKKNTVNVYGWYGIIPSHIIKDFKKETGISVNYDIYDNNETLEAKLVATANGRNGYDVIFPSLTPYATRQNSIGLYQKLDYSKIPNTKNLNQEIVKKIGNIDYFIPYFWGTIGIAINEDIVKRELSWINIDSYDIILNPSILQHLYKYGVSFPEEFVDIFQQTMLYLGLPTNTKNKKCLESFLNHFKKLRPYITKFSSTTIISDLLNGSICIGIGTSDNIYRAILAGKNMGKKIRYILPKEGSVFWLDCMAIPTSAPHTENAYKFINYMLKKAIGEEITKYSGIYTTTSDEKINPEFIMGAKSVTKEDMYFDKAATRTWSQIRLKKF
jgi:putrescine transport system substrate-binding protein